MVKDFPEVRTEYSKRDFLIDTITSGPFISVHVGCILVFFVSFSWWAVALCLLLYVVRMFGITAGFHRYFSHRTFKTSRTFQFILALLATSAAQRGPLWWAATIATITSTVMNQRTPTPLISMVRCGRTSGG